METQGLYKEAISFLSRHDMHKTVVLASRYIQQRLLGMQDVEKRVLEQGKQLVKRYAHEKEKDKLLSVIHCIPPTLQVKYLKDAKAYAETATALESVGKCTEAYELMLEQGLYARAFQLASDNQKQKEVVVRVSTSKLEKPPADKVEISLHVPQSDEHTDYEVIPSVHEKLRELCESENGYEKAVACLLYGKLTKTEEPCRESLKVFREINNKVGEYEAFFALVEICNMKKNIKYVEEAVRVCNGAKAIIMALRSHAESCSASSVQIMHQVEYFYGLKCVEHHYVLPRDQCTWVGSLAKCRVTSKEESSFREENLWTLDRDKVCEEICHHLESGMLHLLDNSDAVAAVERSLVPYKFHKQKIDRSYKYSTDKILDYFRHFALGLEIMLCLPPDKVSKETKNALQNFLDYFPTLFTFDGLLYLSLNEKHFKFIRKLPMSVQNILREKNDSILKKHTDNLRVDEWIVVWILLHVLGQGDATLNTEMRNRTIKRDREKHYFVTVDHRQQHNFHQWIRSCSLLRSNDKALIGVKVLFKFIEVIARRRSLRISVTNIIHIMCVCSMTAYTLLALSAPKTVIIVPQLLRDIMLSFDRINCQKESDKTIFQSCTETCKRVNSSKIRDTTMKCLEKMIMIVSGIYNRDFNILDHMTSHAQEYTSELTACITLALTLLGNLSLTGYCRSSDLQTYQRHIYSSLVPIKAQTKLPECQDLTSICEKFVSCTNAKSLFSLILPLNRIHQHSVDGGTEFYEFQTGRNFQLKLTYLHRIPQINFVPLQITGEASGTDSTSRVAGVHQSNSSTTMHLHRQDITCHTDMSTTDTSATGTLNGSDKESGTVVSERSEAEFEISPALDSQENNEEIKGSTKLESQISGGDISDDEVTEALALEEEHEGVVEEALDINTSEIDSDFCRICGVSLQSSVSDVSNAIIKRHIDSAEHRLKDILYKKFQGKIEEFYMSKKGWEEEVKGWESVKDGISDVLEPFVHDVKEELKRFEDTQNSLQRSYQWEEGMKVLQEFNDKIKKLLNLGREEYIRSTRKEADKSEPVAAKDDEEKPNEELSEEDLSDIEAGQDSSRKKRRQQMKKKRQNRK